ncbi:MAG: CDP-diacylglycerol--glycerol-3-phosphate 3-phosphatidyltransferase [Calditrichaeota bacterium]|nr:MAG: CDP-diacylglycerol--glycerol-3-phosphate 3-phosphatidyltransferase [Calditrichota bacterium]
MRLTVPNQLTILRILLTPVFLFLILQKKPSAQLAGSIVYCIAALTDWYDGWYARKFGVITRTGQFMDPLADKILVSSALIAFVALDYVIPWMVWVIIARDAFITSVRIYALHVNKPIITHILAKWKTFAQMLTIFLILIMINLHNYFPANPHPYRPTYTDVIGISMLIVTILTVLSAVIYIFENKELLLNILRKLFRL